MSNENYSVAIEDKNNLLKMIKPFIHSENETKIYNCIEQIETLCSPCFAIVIIVLESIFPEFNSGWYTNIPKDEFLKYLMSIYK